MSQVVPHHFEQLPRSRLENLSYETLRQKTRWPVPYRWNLNFVSLWNQGHDHITVCLLDFFGFDQRCAHPDGEITCEVIAANRNHRRVRHGTLLKDNEVR